MNATALALLDAETRDFQWFEVGGDHMEPTLRRGDHVAVAPGKSYLGEGLYLFNVDGGPVVYRCESDFRGGIKIWGDNALYPRRPACSREEFQGTVFGKVVILGRVVDRSLLERRRAGA